MRDEEVPLPEEQVELEVEGEDGGRGRHDQRREGGAERHAQQEVVGGAALRPEGLQGAYSVVPGEFYICLQGDHSRCSQPPIDTITKVTL